MMLFGPKGPALHTLRVLKKARAMRHVRWTVRGKGECDRLIIGIAQVHPVLHGRFERFQARKIAKVQAQIFEMCHYLHQVHGVTSFGQEGYAGRGRARLPQTFLQNMKQARGDKLAEKSTMLRVAYKWRKALHKGKAKDAETYATMLNALTVLQAIESDVTVFPIEQADVHGPISAAVTKLQQKINDVEQSAAFKAVKRKRGKSLSKTEYEAAKARNALVKEFNQVLRNPQRDRAILRQVLKAANGPVNVFVLGTGHRAGMLSLAAEHLPPKTALVWAEPPRLWWLKVLLRRVFWGLIIGSALIMFIVL